MTPSSPNYDSFYSVLDEAPLAACSADTLSGNVLWCNQVFIEQFGDASHHSWEQFFTPIKLRGKDIQGSFRHLNVRITKTLSPDERITFLYCEPLSPLSDDLLEFAEHAASVLVHRMRSPITGLKGFMDMIDIPEDQKPFIDKGFKQITDQLNRLEDITQISRCERQELLVSEVIQSIVANLPAHQRRNTVLDSASGPLIVHSDQQKLHFILKELVINAHEHVEGDDMPEVTVSIFGEEQRVDVSHSGLTLSIEEARQLFHPFFTTKARGMGLGLPRAVQLAKACGHELGLTQNSRTKGVTVSLFF